MTTATIGPSAKLIERIRTANEEIFNRSVRHAIWLERLKTSEANKILAFLDREMLPDLRSQILKLENLQARGSHINPNKFKRIQNLFASTDGLIQGSLKAAYIASRDSLFDVAITEAQWVNAMLSSSIPSGIGLEFVVPPSPLIKSIVTSRPFEGRLLKNWFSDISASTKKAVKQQVNIGIAQGDSVPNIVKRVTQVANVTRRHADAVVRTAVSHVTNQASAEVFKANQEVIKQEQFIATLDGRTTPICRSLDGEVYDVGEGPIPPLHIRCRSRRIPVLKSWKELGIDLDEAPEGTRASMNGQVPANMTYGKWLKGQTKEIQDEILGPSRARMFRSGKLKIDDFVDNLGKPLTLEQLKKLEKL